MTIDITTIPTPVTDANPGIAAAVLTELRNVLRLTAPDPTHLTTSDLDRWLHHEANRLDAQQVTETRAWLTALPTGEVVTLESQTGARVVAAIKTDGDYWAGTSGALSTADIASRNPVHLTKGSESTP